MSTHVHSMCVRGSALYTKTVWSSACEVATWRVIFDLPTLRKSCKKCSLLICVKRNSYEINQMTVTYNTGIICLMKCHLFFLLIHFLSWYLITASETCVYKLNFSMLTLPITYNHTSAYNCAPWHWRNGDDYDILFIKKKTKLIKLSNNL